MKPHIKIYMDYFGYGEEDFIPSELSGLPSNDCHHIERRGSGGRKGADVIENLMALTREEHIRYGDKKQYKEWLKQKHFEFMENYKSKKGNGSIAPL